jgi:acyl dehydratase
MLRYFASGGAWPPVEGGEPSPIPKAVPKLGDRGVNMNALWQYFRPAVVGDSLKMTWIVDDVYLKTTRLDPKSVWIVTAGEVTNQHDQPVARCTNTVLFHRPAHDHGDPPGRRDTPRHREPEAGDGIGSFDVQLTPTSTVLQVSGSQYWNRVHHDPGFAHSSGHDSIFFNTGWTEGLLCRLITTYIGLHPWWLEQLEFRMTGMNIPGDRVTASGRVVERTVDDVGVEVRTVVVELANERVGRTTSGTAVVRCAQPDGMAGRR